MRQAATVPYVQRQLSQLPGPDQTCSACLQLRTGMHEPGKQAVASITTIFSKHAPRTCAGLGLQAEPKSQKGRHSSRHAAASTQPPAQRKPAGTLETAGLEGAGAGMGAVLWREQEGLGLVPLQAWSNRNHWRPAKLRPAGLLTTSVPVQAL